VGKGVGVRTYVVVVLLHGDHPWNVVKGHGAYAEIFVIRDLAHFPNKAVQVWGRDAVNSSEEVGRSKTVVVSGRTAALRTGQYITMDQRKRLKHTLALT
jgi:hypothetical protein